MKRAPLLSQEDIDQRLADLTHWHQEGRRIAREFTFASFKEAIDFVNQVAEAAEEMDHHPDFDISYKRVILSNTTHSEGGLTRRDFRLAEKIDQLHQVD